MAEPIEKLRRAEGGQRGHTASTAYTAYPKVKQAKWPDPLGEAAYHGLAGEFARLVEPHTEADPVALLVQFLGGFGSLIGRGPHFVAEADRHYTNLYVALVGRTSKARKGSSKGHVDRVLRAVDEDWIKNRQQGGLSSGEGLIWAVRDAVGPDAGVGDKRLLAYQPELASMLRVMGREGNTLSPVIRLGWDTDVLQILNKNSPARATGAHISIVGHVTKDELRRYLDRTETASGFANRFLWVCVKRAQVLPEGGAIHTVGFERFQVRLSEAVTFARSLGERELKPACANLPHLRYPK